MAAVEIGHVHLFLYASSDTTGPMPHWVECSLCGTTLGDANEDGDEMEKRRRFEVWRERETPDV